jgi:triosephosphate isomerase
VVLAASVPVPLVLLNLKTYREARGRRALAITRAAGRVARDLGVTIAVAPSPLDLGAVCSIARVPVFAQHVDPVEGGQHTGAVPAEHVRSLGAAGTLLNHSEKRLAPPTLSAAHAVARRAGLVTVVCAGGPAQAGKVAALRPDFVAIEPPDLIGGSVSVSSARPAVVERGVAAVRAVARRPRVLCGAGVKTREDVRKALELGTHGVLLASGVARARDPARALRDLAQGLLDGGQLPPKKGT